MHKSLLAFGISLALTGMALAHAGTKDPTVKAWMANMKEIGAETKTLGLMVRGQTDFDAALANAALARLAILSEDVPTLFATRADDPTSEARDLIWTDWADYEEEAEAMARLASSARVSTPEDLASTFKAIGATCTSCHSKYRD